MYADQDVKVYQTRSNCCSIVTLPDTCSSKDVADNDLSAKDIHQGKLLCKDALTDKQNFSSTGTINTSSEWSCCSALQLQFSTEIALHTSAHTISQNQFSAKQVRFHLNENDNSFIPIMKRTWRESKIDIH